jgi:hypothetical protein
VPHKSLPDKNTLTAEYARLTLFNEETELDRLYAAPLEEFTKLRNEIAALAREEGDQEAAARIAVLRKPSASAWVVNQISRSSQTDLQRLINAGEALEEAQRQSLSGKGASGFEAARKDESDAVRLVRGAVKKLFPTVSATTLDRVITSMRAGAASDEGRVLLRKGRLTEDLEPPGFGVFAATPTPAPTKTTTTAESRKQAKVDSLRKRRQEAEAKANDLEAKAEEAEALANKASMQAAAARRRADEALAQVQKIDKELFGL